MNNLFEESLFSESSLCSSGINKIIMFSNNSHYSSEIFANGTTQIAGSNGSGKTTLLNSVQFLYDCNAASSIDGHEKKQTVDHYFPNEDSFLLFEISTPSNGFFVIGYNKDVHGDFYRFFYNEEYDPNDYIESFTDGIPNIRKINDIKNNITRKETFSDIKDNNDYYNLISGTNNNYKSLKLVPGRDSNGSKDSYKNFINIFKHINKIADNPSQRELKEMLVNTAMDSYSTNDKLDGYREDIKNIDDAYKSIQHEKEKSGNLLELSDNLTKIIELKNEAKSMISDNDVKFNEFISKYDDNVKELEKDKQVKINEQVSFLPKQEEIGKERERLAVEENKLNSFVKEYSEKIVDFEKINLPKDMLEASLNNVKNEIHEINFQQRSSKNYQGKSDDNLRKTVENIHKENKNKTRIIECDPYINKLVHKNYNEEDANKIFFVLNKDGVFSHLDKEGVLEEDKIQKLFKIILESYNENSFSCFGLSIDFNQSDIENNKTSIDEIEESIRNNNITIKNIESELELRLNEQLIKNKIKDLEKKESDIRGQLATISFIEENKEKYGSEVVELEELKSKLLNLKKQNNEEIERDRHLGKIISSIKISIKEINEATEYIHSCSFLMKENFSHFKEKFRRCDNSYVTNDKIVSSLIDITNNKLREITNLESLISANILNINMPDIDYNKKEEDILDYVNKKLESFHKKEESFYNQRRKALDGFGCYLDNVFNDINNIYAPIKEINRYFKGKGGENLSNIERVKFEISFEKNKMYEKLSDYIKERDNGIDKENYHEILYKKLISILDIQGGLSSIDIRELFTLKIVIKNNGEKPKYHDTFTSAGSNGTVISIKLMFFVFLLRKSFKEASDFYMLFFIDEAASIDTSNFDKVATVAKSLNMRPIVASPEPITPEEMSINCYYPRTILMDGGKRRLVINKNSHERLDAKKEKSLVAEI